MYFSYQNCIVDTIASLQGADGKVILVSKVHELLTLVLDFLDNAVSKLAANSAHIHAKHFFCFQAM